MSKRRVVITGIGAVTPLGNSIEETWANIKAGKSGIGELTRLNKDLFAAKIAAEVKDFDIKERHFAADDQETSDLAVAAAKEAIANAGITPEEIGLILVATVTQDQTFPSVACMIQEQIGAVNAAAMD